MTDDLTKTFRGIRLFDRLPLITELMVPGNVGNKGREVFR